MLSTIDITLSAAEIDQFEPSVQWDGTLHLATGDNEHELIVRSDGDLEEWLVALEALTRRAREVQITRREREQRQERAR